MLIHPPLDEMLIEKTVFVENLSLTHGKPVAGLGSVIPIGFSES